MALPNPSMSFSPFAILTAEEMNDLVENIEALADGSGLDDGAVIPSKLVAGTGTTWVWQSWVPTFTNVSGGTLNTARYAQIGKTVVFELRYTLAGAGMGATPRFTLPVTANASTALGDTVPMNIVSILDSGTARYHGVCTWNSTTAWNLGVINVAGTYEVFTSFSSTVPMTWASGDFFFVRGMYEAA